MRPSQDFTFNLQIQLQKFDDWRTDLQMPHKNIEWNNKSLILICIKSKHKVEYANGIYYLLSCAVVFY